MPAPQEALAATPPPVNDHKSPLPSNDDESTPPIADHASTPPADDNESTLPSDDHQSTPSVVEDEESVATVVPNGDQEEVAKITHLSTFDFFATLSGVLTYSYQDDFNDGDSALGMPFQDSLMSLRSSILGYHHENGRTYHAMSAGKYFLPNDKREIERLDLQHHVLTVTIQGSHCLCPKNNGAKRVLDLGTGTGIWAMEYADAHPEAEVIGVDLSPVQPEFVPPNCYFEIDDLEKEWTWSRPFDFIFSRMMAGSFTDNGTIVQKVFAQLEPGGYFEAQDMGLPMGCDDGTLKQDSDFWEWMSLVMESMVRLGRPIAAHSWKTLMEECGFEDVTETIYKWPTNSWPRESRYKELGMWSLANMDSALEPSTLAPLTRGLGWSHDEVLVLVSKARKQLRDPNIHAYWPMYFVHGRKPLNASEPNPTSQVTLVNPGTPGPIPAALPKVMEPSTPSPNQGPGFV